MPTGFGLQQLAAAMQPGQPTSVNEHQNLDLQNSARAILVLSVQLNNPSVSAEAQPPRDPPAAYLIPLDGNIY